MDEKRKHEIHPDIRSSRPNRWQTQLQSLAETITQAEHGPLPRQPPNAWSNKIVKLNDPESFPKLQGRNKPRANPTKSQSKSTQEKTLGNQEEIERYLRKLKKGSTK